MVNVTKTTASIELEQTKVKLRENYTEEKFNQAIGIGQCLGDIGVINKSEYNEYISNINAIRQVHYNFK